MNKRKRSNKFPQEQQPDERLTLVVWCYECGNEEVLTLESVDLDTVITNWLINTDDEEIELEIVASWNCSHCGTYNETGHDDELEGNN